jgi:hypothetical protein
MSAANPHRYGQSTTHPAGELFAAHAQIRSMDAPPSIRLMNRTLASLLALALVATTAHGPSGATSSTTLAADSPPAGSRPRVVMERPLFLQMASS